MAFFVKAPFILLLAVVLSVGWLGWTWRRQWPALLCTRACSPATGRLLPPASHLRAAHQRHHPAQPAGRGARGEVRLDAAVQLTGPDVAGRALAVAPDRRGLRGRRDTARAGLGRARRRGGRVAVSVFFRRRAWLAWLVLFAYFALADVVPVMNRPDPAARAGPERGRARYVSSTATVVAIAIGLAFIPLTGEERPWLRVWPRLRFAWLPLAAAVALGSVWSVAAYAACRSARTSRATSRPAGWRSTAPRTARSCWTLTCPPRWSTRSSSTTTRWPRRCSARSRRTR